MAVVARISADGHTVRIQVSGRFDFATHGEFRGAYRETDGAATSFVVDLKDADYLDSSALGMLLLLRDHAGASRVGVAIEGANRTVASILRVANFDRLFDVR